MLSLGIWIHQYFQTLHVGSLPCLETSRALLSNFSAFHSHFISIQHNLNPDPRAGENFYNFQGQTTQRRSAVPLLTTWRGNSKNVTITTHRLAMVIMFELPIEPSFIKKVAHFLFFNCCNIKVCSICVFVEAGLGWITSPFHESSTIGWPHRLTILSIGVWHAKGKTLKISYTYVLPTWYSDSRFLTKVTFHPQWDMISIVFSSYTLIFRKLILDPQSIWGPLRTIKWVASEGIKL